MRLPVSGLRRLRRDGPRALTLQKRSLGTGLRDERTQRPRGSRRSVHRHPPRMQLLATLRVARRRVDGDARHVSVRRPDGRWGPRCGPAPSFPPVDAPVLIKRTGVDQIVGIFEIAVDSMSGTTLAPSTFSGAAWGTPTTFATDARYGRPASVAALADGRIAVSYTNESSPAVEVGFFDGDDLGRFYDRARHFCFAVSARCDRERARRRRPGVGLPRCEPGASPHTADRRVGMDAVDSPSRSIPRLPIRRCS